MCENCSRVIWTKTVFELHFLAFLIHSSSLHFRSESLKSWHRSTFEIAFSFQFLKQTCTEIISFLPSVFITIFILSLTFFKNRTHAQIPICFSSGHLMHLPVLCKRKSFSLTAFSFGRETFPFADIKCNYKIACNLNWKEVNGEIKFSVC